MLIKQQLPFRFEIPAPVHRFILSLFYEGKGERVKIVVDPDAGFLGCYDVIGGYDHVFFERMLSTKITDGIEILVDALRIEIGGETSYFGNSLHSRTQGDIRVEGLRNDEFCLSRVSETDYQAVFFGDGYTGGNWKHVDFWCYPDLLCGNRLPFVNAGACAANTRKCLRIVREVSSYKKRFQTGVLMVGWDDIFDGLPFEESTKNFSEIVSLMRSFCDKVVVCNLKSANQNQEKVIRFNKMIETSCDNFEVGFIDVYKNFKKNEMDRSLVRDDFPIEGGQKLIAETIVQSGLFGFPKYPLPNLKNETRVCRLIRRASEKMSGLYRILSKPKG